jgi:hypothetical protein
MCRYAGAFAYSVSTSLKAPANSESIKHLIEEQTVGGSIFDDDVYNDCDGDSLCVCVDVCTNYVFVFLCVCGVCSIITTPAIIKVERGLYLLFQLCMLNV